MTTIAIIFFSGYGHTVKQAEAVRDGAASVAGTKADLYRIDENGNLPDSAMEALGNAEKVPDFTPDFIPGPETGPP